MQSLSEEPLVSCSCTRFLSTGPATADDFQPGIQGIKGHESTCDVMFCQVRQSLVSWLLTVRTAHHCNIYHHCPSLKNMNFLTLWNIQLDSWTNFQCLKHHLFVYMILQTTERKWGQIHWLVLMCDRKHYTNCTQSICLFTCREHHYAVLWCML